MLTKKEENILKSIIIASENDPKKPEFPVDDPKFPATPTYKIRVPGFSNVWLKDESHNPTWTHKDRMAWEIIVTYKEFLQAKKIWQFKGKLPTMSIISSGSAATAIQIQLKRYNLPNLKVLVDNNLSPLIIKSLKKIWCKIYTRDLSKKSFNRKEILKITSNPDWFDITSSEALDPTTRFYDRLSYEVINLSPEYCFIPFGTGNLFENILNINKKEVSTKNHDPRFKWNIKKLRKCNFIWATTNNLKSKAEKLYSPHLPFVHFDEQRIRLYRYAWFCWPQSNVETLKEVFLDKAIAIAQQNEIHCEPSWIAGLAMLLQISNRIPKNAKILIINTWKSKYTSTA